VQKHVPEVIRKIETFDPAESTSSKNCVVVVNSDTDIERRLDFDLRDTWKVVVGGALLSRGFTIEGLTVTYFRRLARAHDTLLQMGRWFGYRPGYGDLVRVYLADNVPFSKKKSVSLYDAFVAIAKSENEFRKQLSQYSGWDGSSPAITPKQVRPFVIQSLPWLKPTAPNKMYNARLKMQREPVFSPKAMSDLTSDVSSNWETTFEIVKCAGSHVEVEPTTAGLHRMSAWVGTLPAKAVVRTLRSIHWLDAYNEAVVRPKANYYWHSINSGTLDDFFVVFPQILSSGDATGTVAIESVGERTTVQRKRGSDDHFGEFTDPNHRAAALTFLGPEAGCPKSLLPHWRQRGRGVILAYIVPERSLSEPGSTSAIPEVCTVGLTIYLPSSATSVPGDQGLVFYEATDRSSDA
jgi:hypothetical protein